MSNVLRGFQDDDNSKDEPPDYMYLSLNTGYGVQPCLTVSCSVHSLEGLGSAFSAEDGHILPTFEPTGDGHKI